MAAVAESTPKKYIGLGEAERMGYGSKAVLRRRVEDGTIPGYMVGGRIKIRYEDLEAYCKPIIPSKGVR